MKQAQPLEQGLDAQVLATCSAVRFLHVTSPEQPLIASDEVRGAARFTPEILPYLKDLLDNPSLQLSVPELRQRNGEEGGSGTICKLIERNLTPFVGNGLLSQVAQRDGWMTYTAGKSIPRFLVEYY